MIMTILAVVLAIVSAILALYTRYLLFTLKDERRSADVEIRHLQRDLNDRYDENRRLQSELRAARSPVDVRYGKQPKEEARPATPIRIPTRTRKP